MQQKQTQRPQLVFLCKNKFVSYIALFIPNKKEFATKSKRKDNETEMEKQKNTNSEDKECSNSGRSK